MGSKRLLLGLACLALTGCGSSVGGTAAASPTPVVATSVGAATTAPARTGESICADPAAATNRLEHTTPAGPAANAVTGDRVTTAFDLEGTFSAAPAPADFVPTVTEADAACQLESLYSPNGFPAAAGRLALATVSIDGARLRTDTTGLARGGAALAVRPFPTYQHRLAWILLTAANNDLSAGCPPDGPSAAPPTGIVADPYEVFVVDATTGTDAVVFEDSYQLCMGGAVTTPSDWQPWEVTSVPWTLVSRAADGSWAAIDASWPDCEAYATAGTTYYGATPSGAPPGNTGLHAWVDRDRPGLVRIEVNRAVGPACGPPVTHRLTLHPATVGVTVPAQLTHAALGVEPSEPGS